MRLQLLRHESVKLQRLRLVAVQPIVNRMHYFNHLEERQQHDCDEDEID